jgi:hypothetical protein
MQPKQQRILQLTIKACNQFKKTHHFTGEALVEGGKTMHTNTNWAQNFILSEMIVLVFSPESASAGRTTAFLQFLLDKRFIYPHRVPFSTTEAP